MCVQPVNFWFHQKKGTTNHQRTYKQEAANDTPYFPELSVISAPPLRYPFLTSQRFVDRRTCEDSTGRPLPSLPKLPPTHPTDRFLLSPELLQMGESEVFRKKKWRDRPAERRTFKTCEKKKEHGIFSLNWSFKKFQTSHSFGWIFCSSIRIEHLLVVGKVFLWFFCLQRKEWRIPQVGFLRGSFEASSASLFEQKPWIFFWKSSQMWKENKMGFGNMFCFPRYLGEQWKKPGYIGDDILPSHIGIIINQYKDPY